MRVSASASTLLAWTAYLPCRCEADEQNGAVRCGAICSRANRRGAGGAKGGGRGECGPAQHAPDSEPHKRVKHVGSHTAAHFCRGYPRCEPYAGKLHVRICAGGARQLASLPRPSPVHDAARRRRDSRAIRRAVNRSSSGGQGYQRGSSRYASGSAAAAVLANQLPRVVSCADACLPRIVRLNMPSRLRSATVIPAMRLSQGPADDGVQTPRRL